MEEQHIGSYRILKKIGAGGMGKVYLGVHQDIPNLKVVLKILSDLSLVERFKQEADKLALLDGHPNICRIKHFFNHGDDMVIAMEYIEGISLDEKIKTAGKLPVPEALQIISEVLNTLEFAHQKGIYHRDIKPGNIMIDQSGRIKIIDFGIAKAKTDPNLTTTGAACGTPAYMAPEQFIPTEKTDYAKVDIYAVGTTLYYMLTGQMPFKGENEFALRDAKLFSEPTRPRTLNSEISKPLEEIILRSIKREPQDRFADASEMQKAIDTIRKDFDPAVIVKTSTVTTSPGPGDKSKKKWVAAIGVIFVIVIVIAILKLYPSGKIDTKDILHDDTSNTASKNQADSIQIPTPTPTGTINIAVTPYGDIYFDNKLLAQKSDGLSHKSDTGRHIIRVENREAVIKTQIDTVALAAEETVNRRYSITMPEAAEEISRPKSGGNLGTVIIGSTPRGADIFIDGQFQARRQTPYTFKLKPGEHLIKVQLNLGGKNVVREEKFMITADSTSKANFNLEN